MTRAPALVAILLTALVAPACAPTSSSPPITPTPRVVELRLEGNGVGRIAKVWGPDERDVPVWGWSDAYPDPIAAIYEVQAGVDGDAACTILVDGIEVAHRVVPADTAVTCWWVAARPAA